MVALKKHYNFFDKIVNNVEKIRTLDYMFEKVENYEEEAKIAKKIIDSL